MKIDIHTHILPPELPRLREKYGVGGFIQLEHHAPCRARMVRDDGAVFREVESNLWDPAQRILECRVSGVSVQVLSTVPVMFSYGAKPEIALELARFLNDHIAQVVAQYPQKFQGLGTVPLQDPELATRELERCVRDLGLAGVQIGTHVNDWNLSDPALFPFFERASALGAAIFVHPWDMMGQDQMPKYWLPWLVGMPAECSRAICSLIFGGVFERLPHLRVALAHGGGSFPSTLGRIEHGFLQRPDLCAVDNPVNPRQYLKRFWVDSLVHEPRMLAYLLELMGEDQIVLGSDYPFPLGESRPGSLIESLPGLSPTTLAKLSGENALRWLGKEKRHFL